MVQPLWKQFLKTLNRMSIGSSGPTSECITKGIGSRVSKGYLYIVFIAALFTGGRNPSVPGQELG